MKKIIKRIYTQNKFKRIKLIDKFIIIAMIILFCESIFSIFMITEQYDLVEKIDVIIQTALASIFGYVISANFIRADNRTNAINTTKQSKADAAKAPGEALQNAPAQKEVSMAPVKPASPNNRNVIERRAPYFSRLQVIVVGSLFIASIIALLIIKYFAKNDSYSLGRLFQFRNIVCGCAGFLIGMPSDRAGE